MATTKDKVILSVEVDSAGAEKRAIALQKAINQLVQDRKDLARQVKAGTISEDEYAKQLNRTNLALKDARKELKLTNRELQSGEDSLEAQRVELIRLQKEWDQLSKAQQQNQNVGGKLKNQINSLTDSIKEQEFGTQRFQRNVGNYAGGIREAFTGAIPGVEGLTTALAGPLGLATAGAAALTKGGEALYELTRRIEEQRKAVQGLTGAAGADLDTYTAKIAALSQTFGRDFNDTLVLTNTLTKEFGGEFAANSDLIAQGFALAGPQADEFADIIREYPAVFRDSGIAAEELISIATTQIREGIYSDKGVDAIKEGLISLREMPKATAEAIDGIGLSSSELQRGIENGTISAFEGIQKISARLDELPPQSNEVGTAIADIFRGAGEDAGLRYLTMLKDINTDLDVAIEKSGEYVQQQVELNAVNGELEQTFNELLGGSSTFFTEAEILGKKFLNTAIKPLMRAVESGVNLFRFLQAAVISTFNALGIVGKQRIDTVKEAFADLQAVGSAVFTDIKNLDFDFTNTKKALSEGFGDSGEDSGKSFGEAFRESFREQDVELFSFKGEAAKKAAFEGGKKTGKSYSDGFAQGSIGLLKQQISKLEEQFSKATTNSQRQVIRNQITQLQKELAKLENPIALSVIDGPAKSFLESQAKEAVTALNQALKDTEGLKVEIPTELEKIDYQNFEIPEEALNQAREGFASLASALTPVIEQRKEEIRLAAEAKFAALEEGAVKEQAIADEIAAQEEKDKALKVSRAVAKAAAIADLAISLGQQQQAISLAASKLSAAFPPVSIPLGIAYGVAQGAAALINARQRIAEIRALETGGFSGDGQPMAITHNGRMVKSRKSYATGGMITGPTLALTGEAGTEYVAPNAQLRKYPALFDFLNRDRQSSIRGFEFGGYTIPAFQDGGFSARASSSAVQRELEVQANIELSQVLKDMPAPVVTVEDIRAGMGRVAEVEGSATI